MSTTHPIDAQQTTRPPVWSVVDACPSCDRALQYCGTSPLIEYLYCPACWDKAWSPYTGEMVAYLPIVY
jgi:hypothetical protein